LCHLFASSKSLLSFFERHKSALKNLGLRNIQLDKDFEAMDSRGFSDLWHIRYQQEQADFTAGVEPNPVYLQEWPQVLQEMSKVLHFEQATVSGGLWADHRRNGLDLDQNVNLSAAIGEYLVMGDQMPLDESNCLPRLYSVGDRAWR
jgi:hypothetical protein